MKYQFLFVLLIFSLNVSAQKVANNVRWKGDTCTLILQDDQSALKRMISAKAQKKDKKVVFLGGEKIVGYCMADGKIVIPCSYDFGEPFFKGYAVVGNKELQGIIDSTGKVVIPMKYKRLSNMSEGLAFFSRKGDKIDGVVDINGKESSMIIPVETRSMPLGTSISNVPSDSGRIVFEGSPIIPGVFSEGFVVLDWHKIIDREGKQIFVSTHAVFDCKDGMFRIRKQLSTGEMWYGFVNTKGVVVVQPIYRDAEDFSNGKALVTSGSPAKPIKKYINKFGAVVETLK